MQDDLVKRLRANGLDECDEAIDRIAELEAKLAKAVEALELADAALSGAHMNMRVVERKVKATIAELKGDDDD